MANGMDRITEENNTYIETGLTLGLRNPSF